MRLLASALATREPESSLTSRQTQKHNHAIVQSRHLSLYIFIYLTKKKESRRKVVGNGTVGLRRQSCFVRAARANSNTGGLTGRSYDTRNLVEATSFRIISVTSHHTTHHITSHHITLHHITSHHITSHHITSHHSASQYTFTCNLHNSSHVLFLFPCPCCVRLQRTVAGMMETLAAWMLTLLLLLTTSTTTAVVSAAPQAEAPFRVAGSPYAHPSAGANCSTSLFVVDTLQWSADDVLTVETLQGVSARSCPSIWRNHGGSYTTWAAALTKTFGVHMDTSYSQDFAGLLKCVCC